VGSPETWECITKGRYVLCIYAFLLCEFCFGVGPFFYDFVKLRIFFITKNLVLIFKSSTRESFYYTQKDFTWFLGFLNSKGKREKYKYVYKKNAL